MSTIVKELTCFGIYLLNDIRYHVGIIVKNLSLSPFLFVLTIKLYTFFLVLYKNGREPTLLSPTIFVYILPKRNSVTDVFS